MSDKVRAEREEEFAAGRTGMPCPFCGDRATRIIREEDRRGTFSAEWECDHCDERGPCLFDGTPVWLAEAGSDYVVRGGHEHV